MYCSTLQHSAARCNSLQHIATHCNTIDIYMFLFYMCMFWHTHMCIFIVYVYVLYVYLCIFNTLQHTATQYVYMFLFYMCMFWHTHICISIVYMHVLYVHLRIFIHVCFYIHPSQGVPRLFRYWICIFSNVSPLLLLLYKIPMKLTFEKFSWELEKVTRGLPRLVHYGKFSKSDLSMCVCMYRSI